MAKVASWGKLSLTSFETGEKGHPLAKNQPSEVSLSGPSRMVVGRWSDSIIRISKSLVWISNKHFALERDQSNKVWLRDTSSNGTWINGDRAIRDAPTLLRPGDAIQLAAEEEPGQHRQVIFTFELPQQMPPQSSPGKPPLGHSSPAAAPPQAVEVHPHSAKRQRMSSTGSEVTETLENSLRAQPGAAAEVAVSSSPEAAFADLAALRARAERAEAELAAERDARTAECIRSRMEASDVLGEELRRSEDVWAAEHARLNEALAAARADHESQRERLTQCASEANVQCQRAVQEKLEAERTADAAQRQIRELEAALSAERAKCQAVSQQLQSLRCSITEAAAGLHQIAAAEHSTAGTLKRE